MDNFETVDSRADLKIVEALNAQQYAAVVYDQSPVRVIAGAGSGKTRIITSRIVYLLLVKQVSAHAIVALTFTNKAANQMKERIAQMVGSGRPLPFVGTFHAYCVLLLRKYGSRCGLSSFSIIDEDDQKKLIADILQRHGLSKQYTPKNVLGSISHMKSHVLDIATQARAFLVHPLLFDVYQAYEREKRAAQCLDFDDILHFVLRLFKTDAEFKLLIQRQVRHILIDEYQDTNVVQHALLLEMSKHEGKLVAESMCIVGDEDQSIYSWRGATITNILHFTADFPGTHTIKVEQNYRSVEPILSLANHLIAHNTQRNNKQLWSDRAGKDRIRILTCSTQYQEAEMVTQMIKDARRYNKNYSCAVLYRTHTQSRSLEESFLKHAIPYKVVGGIQFYERKEIKDLLAYLRLVANPYDRMAFMRVLNVPTRGLGPKVEEQVKDCWQSEPFISFKEVIAKLIDAGHIVGKKREELEKFIAFFAGLEPDQKPGEVLDILLSRTRYLSYLQHEYEPVEAQERTATVTELINATRHLEMGAVQTVQEFLQEVALMQELASRQMSDAQQNECVLLMTIHAAKGLEFDCVALVGLEENIFPSSRAQYDEAALEEERRLLYVGITRAKEWLLMSCAKSRYIYGVVSEQQKSRFFNDITQMGIPTEDASFWRSYRSDTYFSDWFFARNSSSSDYQSGNPVMTFKRTVSLGAPSVAHQSNADSWKERERVVHAVFGIGTIQSIESKSAGTIYLTIAFPLGVKKLLSKYVQKV